MITTLLHNNLDEAKIYGDLCGDCEWQPCTQKQ